MVFHANARGSRRRFGLESIFPGVALFEDENADGHPDRLNFFVGVGPGVSDARMWAEILNLAARLAGEVTALDLPVVRRLPETPSPLPCLLVQAPSPRAGGAAELHRIGPNRVALSGSSPQGMAAVIRGLALGAAPPGRLKQKWKTMRLAGGGRSAMDILDRRGETIGRLSLPPLADRPSRRTAAIAGGLLDLADGLYEAPPGAPRVRRLRLSIDVDPRGISLPVGLALCDVAARAALEATAFELPLASAGSCQGGLALRVREGSAKRAGLRIEPQADRGPVIQAEGRSRPLAACLREWMRLAFETEGPGGGALQFRHGLQEACDIICGGGRWGAWAHLLAASALRRQPMPSVGRADRPRLARACRAIRLAAPGNWSGPALRFSERWAPETRRVIEEVSRIPRGTGDVQGLVLVSKPAKARRALKAALQALLRAKGYRPRLTVLNAYKAGLSWLLEVVQPELKRIKSIGRLELAFQPFSAAPGGLEMESRFLQEIYPGPDLIARSLGWPPEKIRLVKRPALGDAFRVRAWDPQQRLVLEKCFTPRWSQLPYLPGRPHLGRVHPACGGVLLSQGGRVILDRPVATDREMFWRIFQERWLPAVEAAMATRLKEADSGPPSVFWEDLRMEVAIDESDDRLGLGAERVAPMEALHEDLYFVLLDFFKVFVQEKGLGDEVQFGRIFPQVSPVARKGVPTATLTARPLPPQPRSVERPPGDGVTVQSFGIAAGRVELGLAVTATPSPSRERAMLCRIARAWGHDLQPSAAGNGFLLKLPRPRASGPLHRPLAACAAPPLNRLIPLSEVEAWVHRLGALSNVRVWQAGATWQDRPVWALEAVSGGAGKHVSCARMRLLKPTLLLNARHHANEVSSTNAALRLLWELGASAWGRRMLKRVNLAAVPLENADGVATLEALLPGAADHKLHAARYNALGVEWYGDYFLEQPRFPEARVKPLLWRRWLPLLVLDAHGVPSHEWDQPFSGCAPGRFRQFWIPRAFIYAIVPFIEEPSHAGYRPARDISRAMDRAIRADGGIRKLDRELKDRYVRYARAWEPDVFPPTGGPGLTILPSEKRLAGLNFGVQRFPVTVSEIVTEVTDEVVSGRLLELCARAHLTAAKALLEWLGRQAPGRLVRQPSREGGLVLSWEAGRKKSFRAER
jgi:hypothetical protein